jgi:hypothetical protein
MYKLCSETRNLSEESEIKISLSNDRLTSNYCNKCYHVIYSDRLIYSFQHGDLLGSCPISINVFIARKVIQVKCHN